MDLPNRAPILGSVFVCRNSYFHSFTAGEGEGEGGGGGGGGGEVGRGGEP